MEFVVVCLCVAMALMLLGLNLVEIMQVVLLMVWGMVLVRFMAMWLDLMIG
jgi:hypothetical protein